MNIRQLFRSLPAVLKCFEELKIVLKLSWHFFLIRFARQWTAFVTKHARNESRDDILFYDCHTIHDWLCWAILPSPCKHNIDNLIDVNFEFYLIFAFIGFSNLETTRERRDRELGVVENSWCSTLTVFERAGKMGLLDTPRCGGELLQDST